MFENISTVDNLQFDFQHRADRGKSHQEYLPKTRMRIKNVLFSNTRLNKRFQQQHSFISQISWVLWTFILIFTYILYTTEWSMVSHRG